MRVRRASDKVEVTQNGSQVFRFFNSSTGFACYNQDQADNDCFDYEIKLCCPRKILR